MKDLKFINDILKPWEELNSILSQPFAIQPELSEFTRAVDTLAISISHYKEINGKRRKPVSLMNDIADTAKHSSLRNPERITVTHLASCFVCNANNQFAFLRNIPFVTYKTSTNNTTYDFMQESLYEIKEIMNEERINIDREIEIYKPQSLQYADTARLKFDERYCVLMDATNIRFFKELHDGQLIPYDPPEVTFEIYR